MTDFTWSEIFMSCEGEGPYTGVGTLYFRSAGCNFECKGFNNPEGLDTTTIEVLGFDPKDYMDLKQIPVISRGCDSIYSWDEKFRHMWRIGDEDDVVNQMLETIPFHQWIHPTTKQPVIFSITGGEPMLISKKLPSLLSHPKMKDCQMILIETNASVPMHPKFTEYLTQTWITENNNRKIIFSNSPKLSSSGEPRSKAIKPEYVKMQHNIAKLYPHNVEQYFKFVCRNVNDINEVDEVMTIFRNNGVVKSNSFVYIMPMACLDSQQEEVATELAELCIQRGYTFCIRLQNILWSNGVGT